jgi:hypothetical protein
MSTTYTIDDGDWDGPNLFLSPGWNMIGLKPENDHYIDSAQVDKMRPLLPQFNGGTVSWTTAKYASKGIIFNGTPYILSGDMTDQTQEPELIYMDWRVRLRVSFLLFSMIDLWAGMMLDMMST